MLFRAKENTGVMMKLTYFQLETQLAKQISPVYILSGEELLLKQDTALLIRKKAKQLGFDERVKISSEDTTDVERLYTLLNSASLLADKQLLELDFRHAAPNKMMSQILQEYSQKPSPNHLLLIDIGKIDDKITRSVWYKALEKIGAVITLWPLPREQLPNWISQRAKKYKLTINQEATNVLADFAEGNLGAAAQALEKLYLYPKTSQTVIDLALVKTILTDESRYSIFDFIENLIACQPARTLHILKTLKQEGTEPTLVLWAITRELRLLADLASQIKQGAAMETLWQKHRIFFRRQAAIRKFLLHFTADDCLHHLAEAAEIDSVIKGAVSGNSWEKLADFCLRFRL